MVQRDTNSFNFPQVVLVLGLLLFNLILQWQLPQTQSLQGVAMGYLTAQLTLMGVFLVFGSIHLLWRIGIVLIWLSTLLGISLPKIGERTAIIRFHLIAFLPATTMICCYLRVFGGEKYRTHSLSGMQFSLKGTLFCVVACAVLMASVKANLDNLVPNLQQRLSQIDFGGLILLLWHFGLLASITIVGFQRLWQEQALRNRTGSFGEIVVFCFILLLSFFSGGWEITHLLVSFLAIALIEQTSEDVSSETELEVAENGTN